MAVLTAWQTLQTASQDPATQDTSVLRVLAITALVAGFTHSAAGWSTTTPGGTAIQGVSLDILLDATVAFARGGGT